MHRALVLAVLPALLRAASTPPVVHLVFILSDDHGWNNVGWRNPAFAGITPSLDALAAQGRTLEHHYAYKMCSPSRASLLTGRLPIHVNQENSASEQPGAGILPAFTTLSERLAGVGYRSHQIGKWHCGQASASQIPTGRGFNSSLGFFNFGEDHYTQRRGGQALGSGVGCGEAVDLWRSDRPGYGLNGTYGGSLYRAEALRVVEAHPVERGLFLFLALQNNHAPLQVPDSYSQKCRAAVGGGRTGPFSPEEIYCGMTAFSDETIGLVVGSLKRRGLWENTLLVFSSDNGGWLEQAGDNTPLRGGKFSDLEGGTRVVAMVAGGLLPAQVRGRALKGYIHMCDWYATFLTRAGLTNLTDERAAAAGLPSVDSIDMWPLITGQRTASPRTEIALSASPANTTGWLGWRVADYPTPGAGYYLKGEGLIVGRWKLVVGPQQQGPFSSGGRGLFLDCGPGCLFDIEQDPSETTNLNMSRPDVLQRMQARQAQIRQSVFAPDRGAMDPRACDVIKQNGGYYGPWLP